MNSGAFGENFPYSNFHDLNMDWIIKIAKDFLDQYTHIQEIIEEGEQNLQDLTASGLEQLQEKADNLEALLQAWYDTHSEDIANQLADALQDLNDWYTLHQDYLNQTLIDKTAQFNNLADAKAADTIRSIPSDYSALSNMVLKLEDYNSFDVQPELNGTSGTNNGITYTKNADGTWTLNGTATDEEFSARNLAYYRNALPDVLQAGRKYFLRFNGATAPIQIYFYKDNTTLSIASFDTDGEFRIPGDCNGVLIRFRIPNGSTFNNETLKYEIISSSPFTDESNLYPTGDTTDRTQEIVGILNTYKVCRLAPGKYYVNNIIMPENTTLIGSGYSTQLIHSTTTDVTPVVKISKGNLVKDLTIWGSETAIDINPLGNYIGILFSADYSGGDESTYCTIDNIKIYNCSRAGISCSNTSINYAKGVYVNNVHISGCHIGIDIAEHSEFNKFTNVSIAWCWYACVNNSGNNAFTACTFHATDTGFYVDGNNPNSGHGILNGCTFAHIGSNEGRAIYIRDCQNGFLVTNCQIWYNSVVVSNSNGVQIQNCEFGRDQHIEVLSGNLTLISGCTFQNDINYPPTISKSLTAKLIMINCYGAVSGNLIQP